MNAGPAPRACEVCGSTAKSVLFRQRFGGELRGALLTGYDVVVCDSCGFGYADRLPPQAAFDDYYERMSRYEHAREGGRESPYAERRFASAAGFIAGAVPDRSRAVLDVGCSSGALLHALGRQGFTHLLGLDPSPACARAGRELYGLRIETGTLARPPAELPSGGLILLSAVLEHVRDLAGALRQVRDMLTPDGIVYVEVPDATRFGAYPDAPFQEFSVEHINYFSRTSLKNLLARHGFCELSVRSVTTEQGEGSSADVLMALFAVADSPVPDPEHDAATRQALEGYIAACRKADAATEAALAPWAASHTPILVWGVGTHTQRLLAEGPLAAVSIAAFVDSDTRHHHGVFHGAPVIGPHEVAGRTEPILVSSRFYQREIVRQIRDELGLANELILLYEP